MNQLTALWSLPCTVSAATPLYPFDLAYDLTPGQLAQKAELASCFLCTQLNMSAEAAAIWAKQLCAVAVVTVNDFLRLTHAQCEAQKLSPASVMRLDECLQQFAGLPENRHAALGTRGCCAWLVPLHSLTRRYGVVLLCLSRGRLRIFCDAPRHLQSRCWFAICLFSAIVLVHGLVTCRGRSRGRCRNSCWYVLSPSLQHFVHFAHLLCFICPISHGVP